MVSKSLTDSLWKEMDSFHFDVDFLNSYKLKSSDDTRKKVNSSIRNIKKRKNYNSRLMGFKIENLKRKLDQCSCKLYFSECVLKDTILYEEFQHQIYKSNIRSEFYSSKSRAINKRKIDELLDDDDEETQDNNTIDPILAEENDMAIFTSLDPNDSFNSLDDQESGCCNLSYLEGDNQIMWNPITSDSLIVRKLVKFRALNIIGAQHYKVLNDLRILSLSFIFPFGHTSSNSPKLCEYLNLKDCSLYCKQAVIPDITNLQVISLELFQLQKAYFNNIHNLDCFEYENNNFTGLSSMIIMNIYNELISWNDINGLTECQFSEQAVLPLLLPLFSGRREFEVSKYDKTMIGLADYKPDLFIMLKLKYNMKMDFFICEIKKPGCSGNKYESDFVKVHREMKSIIDQQVDMGIDDPTCFALLVEGYDCYLYKMNLPYDGEYRSHLLSQFRTLRDVQDLMLLLPAINVLSYLNDELSTLKSKLLDTSRTRRGKSAISSFKKPSFNKAVKI